MTSETHNANAGKDQFGSSGDNLARQKAMAKHPDHGNSRDRENRKGGSNDKNL